ncbi:MAG: hypothetical protein KGQ59_07455 [Bdellovibrionales bacterium]|nr:hypothetical protein [Bdellovibrionales bacterium]
MGLKHQRASRLLLAVVLVVSLGGCFGSEDEPSCVSDAPVSSNFTLSGSVTFGYAPSSLVSGKGVLKLSSIEQKPSRRIVVQAVDNCDRPVSETLTDDQGYYKLSVPGNRVRVRALSRLYTSNFATRPQNGTSFSTACSGPVSWDVQVVDNTSSQSFYAYRTASLYSASSNAADLDIPLEFDTAAGRYTDRTAAPFAIADTIVESLEKICRADPSVRFPQLMVNWSVRNVNASGQKSLGQIGTSHFTVEAGRPQLYILGKENVDTDEFDSHVIAHEFGHYLEYSLYRSDTLGGSHSLSDRLDPRVAFGEGYGNAFSAIATGDPIYVDSMGSYQRNGDTMNIALSPKSAPSNGIHNESSVQYFLWKLYDNKQRDFSRIHQVLKNFQSNSPAFTTLLTFAAHYNAQFGGSSESLRSLWETELETPYHALCATPQCTGLANDVADPFDSKQLIGSAYSVARTYGGQSRPAAFWNFYKPLRLNVPHVADGHDVVESGGSSYPYNKLGYVRWYTYKHETSSGNVLVAVTNLDGGQKACAAKDYLDLYVFGSSGASSGQRLLTADEGATGCPSVSFYAEQGKTYVLTVNGAVAGLHTTTTSPNGGISSYNINVTR